MPVGFLSPGDRGVDADSDGASYSQVDACEAAEGGERAPPEISVDFDGFVRGSQMGPPNMYEKLRRRITADSFASSVTDDALGAPADDARPLLPHEGGKVTSDWRPKVAKEGLGTFMGVFVPSTLSIVGVVLFIRLGWAVGQAGILGVASMYGIGALMCYPTLLSLSAMATNGRVAGGGIYYLLSRSLGPEVGGGIGVLFALANMTGVAFYMQGFTDTLGDFVGMDSNDSGTRWLKFAYGAALLVVQVIICIVSSNLYARSALLVFIIQLVAQGFGNIALFARTPFTYQHDSDVDSALTNLTLELAGPSWDRFVDNLLPDFDDGNTYSSVFGIMFPSLTGIMAGANMSGVLKRPELAIPRGSLMALTTALAGYLLLVCSLGACVPRATLKNDYQILARVTWVPTIVTVGILVSSASSALTAIQSSARLLQAVSEDNLFPFLRPFGRMYRGEPALAILTSSLISLGLMVIGSLDILAPVLTMFFLLTYAFTNFATLLYKVAGAPNFRPRFRYFHWFPALAGGFLCIGLMFYIQWAATLVSFVAMILLGWYVARTSSEKGWGDVTQALIFHQVRKYLLKLSEDQHVKFWRARILYLCPSPYNHVNKIEFVNHLKKGGLLIIGDVTVERRPDDNRAAVDNHFPCSQRSNASDVSSPTVAEGLQRAFVRRRCWEELIREARLKAFVDCITAETYRQGVRTLLMASGLGGMRPNCMIAELPAGLSVGSSNETHSGKHHMNFVFDEKAPKKRRYVQAAEVWNDANGDAVTHEQSSGGRGWAAAHTADEEFLSVLTDAGDLNLSLAVMANFDSFDLSKMVRRYRARTQVSLSAFTSSKDAKKLKQRIDVWDCPWGSQEDFKLALQLADMLNKQDVWEECTYIRVCSFVEHDDASLAATRERYADLHSTVLRQMRIPGTIQVWTLTEVWVSLLADKAQACAASHGEEVKRAAVAGVAAVLAAAAAKPDASAWDPARPAARHHLGTPDLGPQVGSPLSSVMLSPLRKRSMHATAHVDRNHGACLASHLPLADQVEVMRDLIARNSQSTAVTILPLPPLPTELEERQNYLTAVRTLAGGLGPVLLVWASEGCMTFEL